MTAGAGTALLLTTHAGLEALAGEELRERAQRAGLGPVRLEPRPGGHPARLRADLSATAAQAWALASQMRSVHHVLRPAAVLELPERDPLGRIREAAETLDLPELSARPTFRVRCRRIGHHEFGSPDVERAVGEVLARRYGAPVDLKGYAQCVRADVRNRVCTMGMQLTREALSRRHARPWGQRTGLKPTVAYAALRLAGPFEDAPTILDPFCGSGTMLLEAAELWPGARLLGSDRKPAAVRGTRDNLAANGHLGRGRIQPVDAREMAAQWSDERIDAVVTNPPLGAHLARSLDFEGFYARVLAQAATLLDGRGPIVLLASRVDELRRAVDRAGLAVTEAIELEMRTVTPTLFRIEAVRR